jgi:DMSO reductase anchor subunit
LANREWSLVFFTTLAQWSVGIMLWFTWAGFFSPAANPGFVTGPGLHNPALLALILIGSAMLSSFLHLGNPANAPRALNNLSGSWLSREILAIGAFSLSLVGVLITAWQLGNPTYLKYLMVLSSMCGLVLLWMMIRVYVMPTIPPWNSWHTPVSFVFSALNLGLVTLLGFHASAVARMDGQVMNWLMVCLMLSLFAVAATGFLHQFQLQKLNTGMDGPVYDHGPFYRVFLFRMALLILAFGAVFIILLRTGLLGETSYFAWLYPVAALVVLQELSGRLLFYSSYFRLGV